MRHLNRYMLIKEPIEKFIKLISKLFNGEYNYKTHDNRLVNFKTKTETQLPKRMR
jgi:hypothetical protein